jgi:spermidine synthase
VLQIGFGSGGTCHSVTLHREIASIEVAELSPEVPALARRWFADINRGALDDPRVTLRIVDARSHMAVSDRTYDLILSDSIHPRFRGNATLYSRDYFTLCARRLRPGGLVSTWLPLYGMSVDDLRSVLKSLQSVFPHVQVWYPNVEPNEHTVIIGSLSPITIDWRRINERLAEPAIAADLAEVDIDGPYQLLDFEMLGDRSVKAFAGPGRLNTDDHPTLEFLAPRTLHRFSAWLANFEALRAARDPEALTIAGVSPEVRATLDRWHDATQLKLAAQAHVLQGRFEAALHDYAECARLNPDDHEAAKQVKAVRRLLPPGVIR